MPETTRPTLGRRRFLVAAGAGAAALAAGGAVAVRELPVRRWWQDLTGACGEPGPVPPVAGATIRDGSFRSATVPEAVGYAVAFPPGHREGDPLPVAVMLPGRGGTGQDTMRSTLLPDFVAQAVTERGTPAFGLACVDGGDSYWHLRADGEDRMAMLADEFLPLVASRHGLGARGRPRAVVGWSMGGYGAILAGEQHPGTFAGVAAASAAVFLTYDEVLEVGSDAFDSAEDFAAHDVVAGAPRLAGTPVRIDCGRADPFFANDQMLADALPEAPSGEWFEGCHTSESWRVVAPGQVDFLGAALAGA